MGGFRASVKRLGLLGWCLLVPSTLFASQPNMVFFLLDDQRWDNLSCMGHDVIRTPDIDLLADQGTLFENAFCTTPTCWISRASILTGQYMRRHHQDSGNDLSAAEWSNAYPQLLRDAGYYLGYCGKYHVGGGSPSSTFQQWLAYSGQGSFLNQPGANGKHLTEYLGDQAIGILDAWQGDTGGAQPFFLCVGFKSPHVQDGAYPYPYHSDPKYDGYYASDTMPHAKTDTPEQSLALPDFYRASNQAGWDRWKKKLNTEERYQENLKDYCRLVTGVNDQIARVRQKVADLGQADNTVYIYTSDHGYFLGERRQTGKWYIHEESLRVPFIICDPRLPADRKGQRLNQMALLIDLAPTMLDYAGISPPAAMQGKSVRPLIEGAPAGEWRSEFFHEMEKVGNNTVYRNYGIRSEDFVYCRFPTENNYEQLYDVTVDPYQRINLADDPRYEDKLVELRAKTDQMLDDLK